ncbi:MAG TPA: Uma2 family endonuclease, partial [Thermoanaerobaculia bacterium]|nr:Uma2 family endonuclease [Thermoanaerobaculia bacterium]
KSEYLDGEVVAMTGASENHILVVTNLVRELSSQLMQRPCRVYSNDMRVQVSATGLYTYPDVVVVCGDRQFEDGRRDTLLNPTLIIEVFSPTTEAYDRGKKFEHYQALESLSEYVLVVQDEPRVEQFLRQDGSHWLFTATAGLDTTVTLASIQCELAVAGIYDKVDLG